MSRVTDRANAHSCGLHQRAQHYYPRPARAPSLCQQALPDLAAQALPSVDTSRMLDGPDITLFRQPGNLGVLQSMADRDQVHFMETQRDDMGDVQPFMGGAQTDWPAASVSLFVLLFVLALSFQNIFGLDKRLLAMIRSNQAKRLAAENDKLEQARRRLEAQFEADE
ncbi:hypothetical protein WJX73_007971 [Symbiochloris irregularis]|uniref:Uncharacterized protein n=1 Tax=Symbiochloris irregularis TaxID=706552 RepID=A0AAW1P877_9CHLO